MKIFLCSQKSKKLPSAKTVFATVLTFLLASLISSQGYMFFSSKIMPVSLSETYPAQERVINLKASGNFGDGSAVVYVDGEEYCAFENGQAQIVPSKSCVVEVLAGAEADFKVEASVSEDVRIVSGSSTAKCTEGMNFICRCYCPQ